MPQTLTAESPLIYPVSITVPADSDSPLASLQLKTSLKQLADRTDFMKDHADSTDEIWDEAVYLVDTETNVYTGTSGTAYGAVTGPEIEVDAAIGDRVVIGFSCQFATFAALQGRLALFFNGAILGETIRRIGGTEAISGRTLPVVGTVSMNTRKIVTVAGAQTIDLRIYGNATDDLYVNAPLVLQAWVYRPNS
jgi:hypothetical protein